MNKRARMRLIGVTVIIVISLFAIFLSVGATDGAYSRDVGELLGSPEFVGERVKVSGTVIPGSWDGNASPMRFDIRDRDDSRGPILSVVYNGSVPATFGDEVTAILTGHLTEEGYFESESMMTECPSKYESAEGALTVIDLMDKADGIVGLPVRLTGFVVADTIQPPGGDTRFTIADRSGEPSVNVYYGGALPDGMTDGSQVVLGGSIDAGGVFEASSVSMSDIEQ